MASLFKKFCYEDSGPDEKNEGDLTDNKKNNKNMKISDRTLILVL